MTFAAGVLLAVVAVDLVINARGAAGLHWTVIGMLCGAAVFSSVNWLLSQGGAQHRKRCGECVEQPEEEQQPGSGLAIAAGTFLDGVPEGVVLGLSVLHHGAPGLGTVAAFFSWRTSRKLYRAAPECGERGDPRSTCLACGLESP
jgi:zinc transporter, ZIP family